MQNKHASAFSLYAWLWPYIRQFRAALVFGVLGNMLYGGIDAGFTYVLKPILDKGFVARNQHFIHQIPFIILGLFIARFLANFFANFFMVKTGRGVVMKLRQAIFHHLMILPVSFYDRHSGGELLSTMIYNVEMAGSGGADTITKLMQAGFMVLGLLGVMFMNSWRLSLIFIAAVPFIGLIMKYANRGMREVSHTIQDKFARVSVIAEEVIECFKVVRIYGGQKQEQAKFDRETTENYQHEVKLTVLKALTTSGVQVIAAMVLAVIIYLATLPNTHWTLSVGSFVALVAAMMAILKPMKQLTNISGDLQKGFAALASVAELLDEPIEQAQGNDTLHQCQGHIVYDNVSFVYSTTNKQVLKELSFECKPGEMVALVGASGSGKSTTVNLLARFYDYQSGQISVDGRAIETLSLTSLRDNIALVSQQVALFNDTVRANICYGSKEVSEERLRLVAKQAQALAFIDSLPHGFDTMVGDNGVLLSGGQRQRLAIARALIKDAPILILDEATSALDTESEREIQKALNELMKSRTTLVIAHRLSTIEQASQILVFDEGRIVERGTHKSLLAQGKVYAKLHQLQINESQHA